MLHQTYRREVSKAAERPQRSEEAEVSGRISDSQDTSKQNISIHLPSLC